MRHDSLLSYCPHCFQILSHDVRYPADLGIAPQVVHRRTLIVPGFAQSLERYVEADLGAEFEAISNRLRDVEYAYLGTTNVYNLDALGHCQPDMRMILSGG
jgi:hypothetical protein